MTPYRYDLLAVGGTLDTNTHIQPNGVARMLKKLRTSNEDYWIMHWFSSIESLFQLGTSLRGKNLLSEIKLLAIGKYTN